MRRPVSLVVAALAMGRLAQGAATVYMAGDSTMAKGGAGDGDTDGMDILTYSLSDHLPMT